MTDLRIGRDRVRLYGIGLALIGLTQLRFVAKVGQYWDWVGFYSAGALAGTRTLLDPVGYTAWGNAHGLAVIGFAYTPGFAWMLVPASALSIAVGFSLNAIAMALAALMATRIAVRAYGIPRNLALYMMVGWAPITAAVITGQNSPLGLLLSMITIDRLARSEATHREPARPSAASFVRSSGLNQIVAGAAVGALCYKPTYSLPFVLLLLLFRKWKALGVVAICAVLWYDVSATASGNDWRWPVTYLHSLAGFVGPDFAANRFKAVSLPGVLILVGTPTRVALAVGAAALVGALFALPKQSVLFAASMTAAIGVATSGHAWAYDAVLVLPALWWTVANVGEPWKTRIIVAAYAIAPLWLASHTLHFDPFALVVIGGAVLAVAYRNSIPTRST